MEQVRYRQDNMNKVWEKRRHPVLNEWVIIASQTSVRPWNGAIIESSEEKIPEFDPGCYLCPGVERANGKKNPDYKSTFVFDNDFASFGLNAPEAERNDGLFVSSPALGICRVVCYKPNHDLVLAQLTKDDIITVTMKWIEEFKNLSKNEKIKNILIFENKGTVIGVSNPHPHGQIYATGFIPVILEQELKSSKEYLDKNGKCLFCEIIEAEKKDAKRIIYENETFIAFVPYYARYSYEVNLYPKRHFSKIDEMSEKEIEQFADILRVILCKYDNLYGMVLPNIMMFHNSPVNGLDHSEYYHFHLEFYPPLRSPDKLKYLAGFESGGGNIINPTDPDFAAELLRRSPEIHFRNKK
jgi:UDPglucose--hexose-1-phosphate uridylyltransferase